MSDNVKMKEMEIDPQRIAQLLAKGQANFFHILEDYVSDVKTLVERMQDLYMVDEDTKLALAMLGCIVSVKVECTAVDIKPLDIQIGGRMEVVKKDELQTKK